MDVGKHDFTVKEPSEYQTTPPPLSKAASPPYSPAAAAAAAAKATMRRKVARTTPPRPSASAPTPPVPVQLFINEHDLVRGRLSEAQSPWATEPGPLYLQLFIDEQDLRAQGALFSGPVQLYIHQQGRIAESLPKINQPVVTEMVEYISVPDSPLPPPTVSEFVTVFEAVYAPEPIALTESEPAEKQPPTNSMSDTNSKQSSASEKPIGAEPPSAPELTTIAEHAIKPEPSIMREETCAMTKTPDTIPDEHKEMLLASIDLEKDHATAAGPGSPYMRLCESLNQLRADYPCPVVLLSSFELSEITSRFVVNLALSLVVKKLRVLLIEGHQRSTDLAAIFELPTRPGFFEWRRGELWAARVISETMLPGLSFMAAGAPSADQGDSQTDLAKETHRWANLRRNYDIIFIYIPGALSATAQDPGRPFGWQLLDLADGMVAVTRLSNLRGKKTDQTPSAEAPGIPGQIQRIKTVLQTRRTRFMGLIALKN